jgi:hypothetical protein
MSSRQERIKAAVEQFISRVKPCENCGATAASRGPRKGGRYGWLCHGCFCAASAKKANTSPP